MLEHFYPRVTYIRCFENRVCRDIKSTEGGLWSVDLISLHSLFLKTVTDIGHPADKGEVSVTCISVVLKAG